MGAPSVLPGTRRPPRVASAEGANLELEAVFWSGMQLLGFPAASAAEAGPAMFRRGNGAGLDQVLHFLLEVVEGPDSLRKRLKGCWPPVDGRQRSEWRRAAKGYLDEYAGQGLIPQKLVASAASMLHTASGNRVVELLCHLSAHALRLVHSQMFPDDQQAVPLPPSHPPKDTAPDSLPVLFGAVHRVATARISTARDTFLQTCSQGASLQASWQEAADALASEYRDLLAQDRKLKHDLEEEARRKGTQPPGAAEAREQEVLRAAEMWEELHCVLGSCAELASNSGVVLHGHSHPNAIDGGALLLPSSAEQQQQQQQRGVNVPALVDAWAGSIGDLRRRVSELAAPSGLLSNASSTSAPQGLAEPGPEGGHLAHARLALKAHSASRDALLKLEEQLRADLREAEGGVALLQEDICRLSEDWARSAARAASGAAGGPLESPLATGGLLLSPSATSPSPRGRPAGAFLPTTPPFRLAPATPMVPGPPQEVATPPPSFWAQTSRNTTSPQAAAAAALKTIASVYAEERAKLYHDLKAAHVPGSQAEAIQIQGAAQLSRAAGTVNLAPSETVAAAASSAADDAEGCSRSPPVPQQGSSHQAVDSAKTAAAREQSPNWDGVLHHSEPAAEANDAAMPPPSLAARTPAFVPDTVERQFAAGLRGFDDDDDLVDGLRDLSMPLEAICCNLVYSPFQAAGDAGSLKASAGGPGAVNGDSGHSAAARDSRQDSAVSLDFSGFDLGMEDPPSPGVAWDENGSPYVTGSISRHQQPSALGVTPSRS